MKNKKGNGKQQEKCRPISFINTDREILNKILANAIQQQRAKRIIQADHVGFIDGIQDGLKLKINIIYYIHKLQEKNHMILFIDAEKHS